MAGRNTFGTWTNIISSAREFANNTFTGAMSDIISRQIIDVSIQIPEFYLVNNIFFIKLFLCFDIFMFGPALSMYI